MQQLNPTLWRTCRVLSGRIRLRLLRQVLESPGANVSQLAERSEIGVSDASQELRRLQSRGLLKRSCQGPSVIYLPTPDPQVPSAAPLLKALRGVWTAHQLTEDEVARISIGLGNERRIAIVRALFRQSLSPAQLAGAVRADPGSLNKHLKILKESGWVRKEDKQFVIQPAANPFMAALLKLL